MQREELLIGASSPCFYIPREPSRKNANPKAAFTNYQIWKDKEHSRTAPNSVEEGMYTGQCKFYKIGGLSGLSGLCGGSEIKPCRPLTCARSCSTIISSSSTSSNSSVFLSCSRLLAFINTDLSAVTEAKAIAEYPVERSSARSCACRDSKLCI